MERVQGLMGHGEFGGEGSDFGFDLSECGGVIFVHQSAVDEIGDGGHVGFLEAAGGDGGGSEANAGGEFGGSWVIGDAVFIGDDASGFEGIGGVGAGEVSAAWSEVDEHEVVIGSAGAEAVAALYESGGEGGGVFDDLLAVGFEGGLEGFVEGDGLGGDDVHEGSALGAWEDGAVDGFGEVFVVGEDESAAWSAEGFVGGGGDDVAVRERGGVYACSDEAGDMGDIGEEEGADFVGDLAEFSEVDDAGVSGVAAEDHFGFEFEGFSADGVEVDGFGVGVEFVVCGLVEDGGGIEFHAVREVSAGGEVEGDELVTGVHEGHEGGEVSVGAGVGLDVGEAAVEELFCAVDGEGFDLVVVATGLVVASVGVTFGVFVGEAGACGGHDGRGDVVFGGDELEGGFLTFCLEGDEFGDLRVGLV